VSETTRVLLFGGSFDPPHRAHLELSAWVQQALDVDRVIFVPAAQNPLKLDAPTDPAHRLAMLQLALADRPAFETSTIELDRGGPSYFVDTLRAMRAELGDDDVDLRFLIGVDQALHFDRWREHEAILELATPVVLMRPPWSRETFTRALREAYDPATAERWTKWVIDAPLIDLSATRVRAMLRDGEDVGDALPAPVLEYIREHRLYTAPDASAPARTERP